MITALYFFFFNCFIAVFFGFINWQEEVTARKIQEDEIERSFSREKAHDEAVARGLREKYPPIAWAEEKSAE